MCNCQSRCTFFYFSLIFTFYSQEFGYTHLSAGDLLRAERSNKDSQYGALIDNYIKEGKIVPVKITCGLLERVRFFELLHFLF